LLGTPGGKGIPRDYYEGKNIQTQRTLRVIAMVGEPLGILPKRLNL